MQFTYLIAIVLALTVAGCSASVESDAPVLSLDTSALLPGDSVSYELPWDTEFSVLQESKINGVPDSYLLVIGSPEKTERLVLTALPAVELNATWPERAAEWEKGFLEQMSRKLVSEPAEFDSRQTHHVVAEAGEGDDSVKIDAYFFTAGKWNYTIALTAPLSANNQNGTLEAVRKSIHVR